MSAAATVQCATVDASAVRRQRGRRRRAVSSVPRYRPVGNGLDRSGPKRNHRRNIEEKNINRLTFITDGLMILRRFSRDEA